MVNIGFNLNPNKDLNKSLKFVMTPTDIKNLQRVKTKRVVEIYIDPECGVYFRCLLV